MRPSRKSLQLAKQLLNLSLQDGQISAERVQGVLAYVSAHPPRQPLAVLRRYQRLVAAQIARNQAVVQHAGAVDGSLLRGIESAFSQQYQRPITATARPEPSLIAGLRIRIGDDVYESSIASQLAALAASST
jgi:F-type H+-transporting ATPase subunit delta